MVEREGGAFCLAKVLFLLWGEEDPFQLTTFKIQDVADIDCFNGRSNNAENVKHGFQGLT